MSARGLRGKCSVGALAARVLSDTVCCQILQSIFVRSEGAEVPTIKSLMAHSYFNVDTTRLTTGMKWDTKSKTIIKYATTLCTAMYAPAAASTESETNGTVPPVTVTASKHSKKSKATADGMVFLI